MNNITLSAIRSSAPKYSEVWALREEVLRKPIGLSLKNEDLRQDHEDDILIAGHNGKVIACLMLHPLESGAMQLRQMAVYDEWQGRGIGRKLVLFAEQFSAAAGYHTIVLHARKAALGFYERLGYKVVGDEFTEVGIPHFIMEKKRV